MISLVFFLVISLGLFNEMRTRGGHDKDRGVAVNLKKWIRRHI